MRRRGLSWLALGAALALTGAGMRLALAEETDGHGDPHAATAEASADETSEGESSDRGPWKLTRPPMPFEIVRSLQFLQDQVARGNNRAIAVQARLLRRFEPVFRDSDPEFWSDPRNLRAAALFILSGGPPTVARSILGRTSLTGDDKALLEGALAYVENRQDEAREKLGSLDFRAMDPALAGHISLALGQIDQLEDSAKAIAHLDRARLLTPGGLIEEAALRLEVLLADEAGDHEKADHLARQYFDRFARSSYAANFQARFAAAYAARSGDEVATVASIDDATARLDPEARLSIFLAVGRRALVEGNLKLAAEASRVALNQDTGSREERQRATLYSIASSLADVDYGEAAATLNALDPALLRPADQDLREAAYTVLEQIRQASTPKFVADTKIEEEATDVASVAERAQRLLQEVSQDLQAE
ncbi:hypothetical protein [Consotaella aegiceratis]|uniref:hypothetical protein n=1 Tax=Consotaella aegiceratis TaxID=3097961 RepID=UPI002F40D350